MRCSGGEVHIARIENAVYVPHGRRARAFWARGPELKNLSS